MADLSSQPMESWRHRILAWIYPGRAWAGEPRVDWRDAWARRTFKTAPAAPKALSLRPGEAK